MARIGPTRQDQGGGNFCAWTLSDLRGKEATLFLFRGAFETWRKVIEGAVVGVLMPTIMPPRQGEKDKVRHKEGKNKRVTNEEDGPVCGAPSISVQGPRYNSTII